MEKLLAFLRNIGYDTKIPPKPRPHVQIVPNRKRAPKVVRTLRLVGVRISPPSGEICRRVGRKIRAKALTSLISRKEKTPRRPLF
jgi:hypothetical protein